MGKKQFFFKKGHVVSAAVSKAGKLCLAIILLLLLSCDSHFLDDCINSTGKLVWEERAIGNFNTLELTDNIDLYITPDTFDNIKVYAGENIISNIATTITDTILHIQNLNACNWLRNPDYPIEVHLTTKSLSTINYFYGTGVIKSVAPFNHYFFRLNVIDGHGDIHIKTNTHHAFLHFRSGTSDINYSGSVDYLGVFLNAFGRFDSRDLDTRHVYINQMSNNDAYTYAYQRLSVKLHMLGNIYYMGNPEVVVQERHGEGDVIPVE